MDETNSTAAIFAGARRPTWMTSPQQPTRSVHSVRREQPPAPQTSSPAVDGSFTQTTNEQHRRGESRGANALAYLGHYEQITSEQQQRSNSTGSNSLPSATRSHSQPHLSHQAAFGLPIPSATHHQTRNSAQRAAPAVAEPMKSLDPLDVQLGAHIASIGGVDKLNEPTRSRVSLLRGAIREPNRDLHLFILHQIVCLSETPQLLPPSLQEAVGDLPLALRAIQEIIRANSDVHPHFLQLCGEFPFKNLAQAITADSKINTAFQAVVTCLAAFARNYVTVVNQVRISGSFFTFEEIIDYLHIPSVVLRRALARRYCETHLRHLTTTDKEALWNILSENEREYASRLTNPSAHRPAWQAHRYYNAKMASLIKRSSARLASQAQPPVSLQPVSGHPPTAASTLTGNVLPIPSSTPLQGSTLRQPVLMGGDWTNFADSMAPTGFTARPPHSRVPPPNVVRSLNQSSSASPRLEHEQRPFFLRKDMPGEQVMPPVPSVSAVHQVHLQSPKLVSRGTHQSRLFRCVDSFLLDPQQLPEEFTTLRYTFEVPDTLIPRLAQHELGAYDEPERKVDAQTAFARLRAVKRVSKPDDSASWVTADTEWPHHTFYECNGTRLHWRLHMHNGQDLPIDLTHAVKPGSNSLLISSVRPANQPANAYAIAIELITMRDEASITSACHSTGLLPAAEAKRELAALFTQGDDDLVCTDTTIAISLTDPMSGTIWTLPVRSAHCAHRECFDLSSFLLSRPPLTPAPAPPSAVDVWRCPICAADARPHTLRLDEWMLQIRAELAQRRLLDTSAILVEQSGEWTPRVHRASLNTKAVGPAADHGPPEVIMLDDD